MKKLYYYNISKKVEYETFNGIVKIKNNSFRSADEKAVIYYYAAVLGIFKTYKSDYLLFVNESEYLGRINHIKIYKINSINCLLLHGDKDEEVNFIIDFIVNNNFYYTYDMIDDEFVWNSQLKSIFNEYKEKTKILYDENKNNIRYFRDIVSYESKSSEKMKYSPFQSTTITGINKQKRKLNEIIKSAPSVDYLKDHSKIISTRIEIQIIRNNVEEIKEDEYMICRMFCGYFGTMREKIVNINKIYNTLDETINKIKNNNNKSFEYQKETIMSNNKNKDSFMICEFRICSMVSSKRIGTRLLSRGVDENGNSSFFVETIFETKIDKKKKLFRILRGSVPLYWSQAKPLQPHKINFERSDLENQKACNLHFKKLEEKYGNIIIIDLLGIKNDEGKLSNKFKKYCILDNKEYINFDVNKHISEYKFLVTQLYNLLKDKIKKIINKESKIDKDSIIIENNVKNCTEQIITDDEVENTSNNSDIINKINIKELDSFIFKERHLRNKIKKFVKKNEITFRVNCLDCLDRTNLVQFLIFNYLFPYNYKAIKRLWKKNGNALSNFYTGSDAMRSNLTTRGRITIMGRVNDLFISANRMLNNKFTDKEKQRIIDILLGNKYNIL